MRRGINNQAALVASLATNQQTRAIEGQGGAWAFDQPNRETRRRMERAERQEAKARARLQKESP
jgi:hypothetical protein